MDTLGIVRRVLPKYWVRISVLCTLLFILLQTDRMIDQWARSLEALQKAQVSLAADVRDLTHEVAGHHAQDSIRSAYFAHATKIQQQRVQRHEGLASADSRPGSICEMQLLIPTARRASLGNDSYKYLGETLKSLQSQQWAEEGFSRLCVLVVNMSPGDHPDFDRLRRDTTARAEAATDAELPEICRTCRPGDRYDGGVPLVGTTCRGFCSAGGFCGVGAIYREGGTDCGEASADLAWAVRTAEMPPRCRDCEAGNVMEGGVPLWAGSGSVCTDWCSAAGRCGRNQTVHSSKGGVDCGAVLRKHLADTSRGKRRPANGLVPVDFRFVEQLNFDDPYDKDHKKDATHNVASFHQARRQALHLSHALLEASRWRSKHVMVIEDDMPTCNASAFRHVARAITLVEAANVATGTGWSMIRVGYGGNGILMHWDDATTAGEYLISNMNRAPVDWLLPEWASSLTEPGSMVNQLRGRRHFTYRLNLFRHIGGVSNFGDRKWTEGKDGLPVCYGLNDFLRHEELFLKYTCVDSMISPCLCQGGTFCSPTIYELPFPINAKQRPRFDQAFAAYIAALENGDEVDATGTNGDAELTNVTLYLSEVVLQFGADTSTSTFRSIKNRVIVDAQEHIKNRVLSDAHVAATEKGEEVSTLKTIANRLGSKKKASRRRTPQ